MKVKVINEYMDKYTGEHMTVGKVTEYKPDRAAELIEAGFVEKVKPKKEPKNK